MALKRKTAPATQPITRDEAKAHCRIDHTDDDVLVDAYIASATSYLDGPTGILGRCIVSQVWELYYDAFPCEDLKLPLGDVITIDKVEYVDPISKAYVIWPAVNYETDLIAKEGWVIPVASWPIALSTTNAEPADGTAMACNAAADLEWPSSRVPSLDI